MGYTPEWSLLIRSISIYVNLDGLIGNKPTELINTNSIVTTVEHTILYGI